MSQKAILVKFDAYWSTVIPYSLIYISNMLKKEGIPSEILHNISALEVEKDFVAFARKIKKINPTFVGFSVITGRGIKYSLDLSKLIKKINKDIKVVWGGIHPSILPEQTLESPYIDYVVSGDGEPKVKPLLELMQGGTPKDLDGISYKDGDQLIINPAVKVINDLDKWTDVSWEDYDLSRYFGDNGEFRYLTSRGCPYNCGFCVNASLGRNKYHITKSIEHVISDIEFFKKRYDIKILLINDDNLFVKRDRAFEILDRVDLPYFAEGRINYIDETFCENLVATKCAMLMCGGESGSDRVLKYIRKGQTRKQMVKAAALLGKYNIPGTWSFVCGFPTETREELTETFKFMRIINSLAKNRIGKPGIFIPYPGTYLYNEAINHGAKVPENIEGWSKFERYTYEKVIPGFDYKLYKHLFKRYYNEYSTIQHRIKENLLNKAQSYKDGIIYDYLKRIQTFLHLTKEQRQR